MSAQTILIIGDDANLLQLASLLFKKAGAKPAKTNHALWRGREFFAHHPNLPIPDVIIIGWPRAGPYDLSPPRLLLSQLRLTLAMC